MSCVPVVTIGMDNDDDNDDEENSKLITCRAALDELKLFEIVMRMT